MSTLLDATVLSHFAVVRRLDLLREAVPTAYVADAVFAEVERGVQDGYRFLTAVFEQFVEQSADGSLNRITVEAVSERGLYEAILEDVDAGEAESLAIASIRGWMFFTDDR